MSKLIISIICVFIVVTSINSHAMHESVTETDILTATDQIIDGFASYVEDMPFKNKEKAFYYVRSMNFRNFVYKKMSHFMKKFEVKTLDSLDHGDILALYNQELNQFLNHLINHSK